MRCKYACGTAEHGLARRAFLGTLAGGSAALLGGGAFPGLTQQVLAGQKQAQQKRMLVIYLHGGVSQLETWDPKPGTDTGGPFRTIATSVPGTHICELLPYTAQQMHHLALVRSVNTRNNSHGKGKYMMHTGRAEEPAAKYPYIGAVASKLLAPQESPLPGHIHIVPKGKGGNSGDAAYLGAKFSNMVLPDGAPPSNTNRPGTVSAALDDQRQNFRRLVSDHFTAGRRTAATDAYTYSFEQSLQLMAEQKTFDVSLEPERDRQRYGTHDFGRHCLLARRLLERDVPYVQISHSNYDTHYENFDFHIEQLGEFDRTFATLIDDLYQRGLLEHTLVVVMSEFGRTPKINERYGRDHWGTAWSVCLAGCGIQAGAVVGKTNDNGTAVIDREVDHGHLFHTYLSAVGIDTRSEFEIAGRQFPVADPSREPIKELLA